MLTNLLRTTVSLCLLSTLTVACGGDSDDTDTNATGATDPTTTATETTMGTGDTADTDDTDDTAGPGTDSESDSDGPDGMFCIEECSADADCQLQGADQGYTCTDGRCTAAGCSGDIQCQVPGAAFQPCASQDECVGQACIDIGGGEGGCAPTNDLVSCADIGQEEVQATLIEGGDITVCGSANASCSDGACVDPCTSDDDCSLFPENPVCNNGTCTCTDASCTDPDRPVCTSIGFCGCGEDSHCEAANGDVCNDGFCGCSDVSACSGMTTFDGTTQICG